MRGRKRLVAALLVGATVLAACGDDDSTAGDAGDGAATTGVGATTEAAGGGDAEDVCTEDRKGGELTMGVGATGLARGMDPTVALGSGVAGASEIGAVYDTLMRYDPDTGEVVPHVAEALEHNDDLTQWTLTLPDDVTFGNGEPLDAEAVRFSVDRLAHATVSSAGMAQEVTAMEVVDDHTITFTLGRPWGSFPYFLATEGGMITNPSVVAAKGDQFASSPIGAGVGPYEVERFVPGEEIVLKAKDHYWGGPVCIDTLRFILVVGGNATYDAFKADELDLMFLIDADPIAQAIDADVQHVNIINGGAGYLLNSGRGANPVLASTDLRLAVNHAIDATLLDDRINDGKGVPTTALIGPGQKIDPGIEGVPYDLAKAKSLVAAAKAKGFDGKVRITCGDDPVTTDRSIAVEAMLTAAGFTVVRQNIPAAQANQQVLIEGNFDIGCGSIALFDEGPVRGMNQFLSNSVRSRTGYENPGMDTAIADLYKASGIEETKDAMGAIQEVWNTDPPWVVYAANQWFMGWKDDVHGLEFTRDASVLFHHAYMD